MNLGFDELDKVVIKRGLCTGCGTCIGACPEGALEVDRDFDFGDPLPALKGKCTNCGVCVRVCPGADLPLPNLEKMIFGKERGEKADDLGIYTSLLKANAVDKKTRAAGADAGSVSALAIHALETGLIDCAVMAGFNKDKPWLTEGKLATNKKEVLACAQSKACMVPNNTALAEAVKRGYKKIGVVGCPCHIWGARMIDYTGQPESLKGKIALNLSLFCGGNVSWQATRHILYELCGIQNFDSITKLQYRGGDWPKHFIVNTNDGIEQLIDKHGYNYHMQAMCYPRDRCRMCFDWAGELADVAVGVYWVEEVPGKTDGYNTIAVRTPVGEKLIESARKAGVIKTEALPMDKVLASYGHEIKKHGGALVLARRQKYGWPTPNVHRRFSFAPIKKQIWLAPQMPEKEYVNVLSNTQTSE